jgi:hypothetical protein
MAKRNAPATQSDHNAATAKYSQPLDRKAAQDKSDRASADASAAANNPPTRAPYDSNHP